MKPPAGFVKQESKRSGSRTTPAPGYAFRIRRGPDTGRLILITYTPDAVPANHKGPFFPSLNRALDAGDVALDKLRSSQGRLFP